MAANSPMWPNNQPLSSQAVIQSSTKNTTVKRKKTTTHSSSQTVIQSSTKNTTANHNIQTNENKQYGSTIHQQSIGSLNHCRRQFRLFNTTLNPGNTNHISTATKQFQNQPIRHYKQEQPMQQKNKLNVNR